MLSQLNSKPYYRPNFSRVDAERFLSGQPVGTFIVRPSSTPDCLALSQRNANGEIFHARILCIRRNGAYAGFSIGGDSEVFNTIDALLNRVQPSDPLRQPNNGGAAQRDSQWAGGRGGFNGGVGMQRTTSGMGGGFRGGPGGGPGGGLGRGATIGGAANRPNSALSPRSTAAAQSMRGGGNTGLGQPVGSAGFEPGSVLQYSTQIDMGELTMDKEIGAGSFGTVYRGRWRRWMVAIKQLKNACPVDSKEYKEFVAEAELMTKLQPHPNVVRFVGVTRPPNLCIVLEFVDKGALYDFLQDKKEQISGELMLNLLIGICRGMAHLHSEQLVHRDLAARNVLLDRNLTPKLADFGMSRVVQGQDGGGQTKSDTGPLKWMAPESIRDRKYSTKSDVWAFAVTVTEVLGRLTEPYPDLEPIQVATRVAYENLQPPIPAGASQTIVYVLQACSTKEPEKRPEFTQLLDWLSRERTVWA